MEPVSATREGSGMKDNTALYCASLTTAGAFGFPFASVSAPRAGPGADPAHPATPSKAPRSTPADLVSFIELPAALKMSRICLR